MEEQAVGIPRVLRSYHPLQAEVHLDVAVAATELPCTSVVASVDAGSFAAP